MCINTVCVDHFRLSDQYQHPRPSPQALVAQALSGNITQEPQPIQEVQPLLQDSVHNHFHLSLPFDVQKKDEPVKEAALPLAAEDADAPMAPRHHCRGCLNKCQTCEQAYCMT
jgi:hypothetical protein